MALYTYRGHLQLEWLLICLEQMPFDGENDHLIGHILLEKNLKFYLSIFDKPLWTNSTSAVAVPTDVMWSEEARGCLQKGAHQAMFPSPGSTKPSLYYLPPPPPPPSKFWFV